MLAELTTTELRDLQAFELLEPFGFPAAERRHADLCWAASGRQVASKVFRYKPNLDEPGKMRGLSAEECQARG